MILYKGKLFDSTEQERILSEMEPYINNTLVKKSLSVETVIAAIDALGKEIASGKQDALLATLLSDNAMQYKLLAATMLSRENLEWKLQTELGGTTSSNGSSVIHSQRMPLGVLFHIAAGNIDGLPAFSIAEGLLTGNINILKLPQADNGLSLEIIS